MFGCSSVANTWRSSKNRRSCSASMRSGLSHLMATHQSRPLVFATAGHEDGIFACGHSARDCGGLLVTYLAKARALQLDQATGED